MSSGPLQINLKASEIIGVDLISNLCRMSVHLPIYSARDTAITQRPTSTAVLAIDSEDRFNDYTESRRFDPLLANNYSFTIRKNESIMNGFFTRLGITELVFPWVIPNINRKTCIITVRFQIGAGVETFTNIVVPIGFYTPAQLASALQVLIRAIDGSLAAFTMTYGAENGLPVFIYNTNNPNVGIAFAPMSYDSTLYPFPPSTKQLFDVLGFISSNNTITIPPGNNDYSGGLTFAQAIRYIDITCSQLTGNQALKDTMSQPIARDVLCRVYIGGAPGEQSTVSAASSTFCPPGCAPTTIYRDFASPKQIQWIPNQPVPGYLKFDVYDDTGAPLSESDSFYSGANNCPWSFTMLVSEN